MKYLIANAFTGSEWDSVSFAVIQLTDEHLAFIKEQKETFDYVNNKSSGLLHLPFSCDNAEWFIDEEELPEGVDLTKASPVIVELKEGWMDKLLKPDQDIRYGKIKISGYGIQYVAYGKHTDEEFWTEDIVFKFLF